MADERDPLVSRRYRELGSEEPPPALDEAILAASRRTAAPRRRWYLPLAAAAVAVLAVGVALHVQREQPDPEAMREEPAQRFRKQEAPRDLGRGAPPAPADTPASRAAPASPPPLIPQTAPVPGPEAAAAGRIKSDSFEESPERWLERIADLRRQGRHEEADKALADFRRRYPDYRISGATLEKIEKK